MYKNKLMSVISPVQSDDHEGSPMGKEVKLSFHFHFLRIIVLPFQKVNKVVCERFVETVYGYTSSTGYQTGHAVWKQTQRSS